MDVTSRTDGAVSVLFVNSPRIDAAAAISFKESVRAATAAGTGPVVMDLSQVEFVDSSGLGAIVAAMKGLGKDRSMCLVGLTDTVAKVFRLTRMDSVFALYPSVDAALAGVQDSSSQRAAV